MRSPTVSLIGPYPPPMGGVSIHLFRLSRFLVEAGFATKVWNESWISAEQPEYVEAMVSFKSLAFRLLADRSLILHSHVTSLKFLRLFPFYRFLGKKLLMTIHGHVLLEQLSSMDMKTRERYIRAFNHLDRIICVGEGLKNDLQELGVRADRLCCITSYFPPVHTASVALPAQVERFLGERDPEPLLVANGTVRLVGNKDVYGLDLLVKAMIRLRDRMLPCRLVVYLSSLSELDNQQQEYLDYWKSVIKEQGLEASILLYPSVDDPFYPILKHASLMIRPTRSEGFGVSVLEAFEAGVPVLAADTSIRQAECLLFSPDSEHGLADELENALGKLEEHRNRLKSYVAHTCGQEILEVYRGVLQS